MLELSKQQLRFQFNDSAPMFTSITLRNTSPNSFISFKVKTTTPELFEVNPSKGILLPGQSKPVEFRTHNVLRKEQAQNILKKERFLLQYLALNDKKSPADIEAYWQRNTNTIRNLKLPIRISGITIDEGRGSSSIRNADANPNSDNGGGNLFSSVHSAKFLDGQDTRTPQVGAVGSDDAESNSQQGKKLDELNQEEERLMEERNQEFNKATRKPAGKSKLKTWVSRLFILALFCAIGFGIHKFIQHRRNQPKILAKTDHTLVTQQQRTIKVGDKQKIEQKVIFVDTKPTTHYEGEHIIIESPTRAQIQQKLASKAQENQDRQRQNQRYQQQQRRLQQQRHAQRQRQQAAYAQQQRMQQARLQYLKEQGQRQGPHIPTKVIVTAPENAEVVVNRVNNQPVRLTIIGAQAHGSRY